MNQIKALLIDDEQLGRENLSFLLKSFCPEIEVVGTVASAEEARNFLTKNEVLLIFLDVEMPKENGFDFLNSINTSLYHIVFVTAYENYALRAIKASAVDYVLKPVDIDDLKNAIDKVKLAILEKDTSEDSFAKSASMQNLKENILNKSEITKITLAHQHGYTILEMDEIMYLKADDNYTDFHLTHARKITVSKTMGEYEDILNPKYFFRIHKSHIINTKYMVEYIAGEMMVLLNNGEKLSVSRRRAPDFAKFIKNVLR